MAAFVLIFAPILGLFVIALLKKNTPTEPVDPATEVVDAGEAEALANLVAMEEADCERLLRRLMTSLGLEVVKWEATSEDAFELIARWPQELIGGDYVVLFMRPPAGEPIESKTMREFKEAAYELRALKGIFITTAQFSQEAHFVGEHYGVELVDGARLVGLLRERMPSLLSQLERV